MDIGWPEGIVLGLLLIETGACIAKDGTPRGNYNAGSMVISVVLWIALLYWGGFF